MEFALLGFGIALVPFLLFMSLFFPFGMGMLILSHYILEVCIFLFGFTGAND
jgi:hypothetical protein